MALTLACQPAFAEYYYTLDVQGSDPSATRYPSADAACHVPYDRAANSNSNPNLVLQPYKPPQFRGQIPPNIQIFECSIVWTGKDGNGQYVQTHFVYRNGDECKSDEKFNASTGQCERPDKEEDRKELGDPTNPHNVGFVACGDPVNPANGNVFESEIDYADTSGSLRFERSYNSNAPYGGWSSTLETRLDLDSDAAFRGAVVQFNDGRSAMFTSKDGKLVADGDEFGTLSRSGANWIYESPSNERMIFDNYGDLTRWEMPDGRAWTIQLDIDNDSNEVTTVTDEVGRSYVYTLAVNSWGKLTAGDLTIDHTFDDQRRLVSVKKTWPDHSSTRRYLYEDQRFPTKLTGIIDERGVRISTWVYDANGRAISAATANGNGKFQFAYDSPTQTTVTNPLGHPVRYGFAIVQGAKRITSIDGEPVAGCPAANSTFTYTPDARLATRANALGQLTTFSYDTQGRETSRTEAKGTPEQRTTTTTWDGTSFRPATVTTSDRVTTYTYDAQGRPLSTAVRSLKD